jgi:hypothetical protein
MKIIFKVVMATILSSFFIQDTHAQIGKDLKKNLGLNKKKKEEPKNYNREEAIITVGGPFSDIGPTSDLHKKYNGQIVFSTYKIPMDNPQESSLQSTFKLSDNIYGRVFMPMSVENYPLYSTQFLRNGDTTTAEHNKYGKFYYNLYVDGVKEKYWNVELVNLSSQNKVNTTTYQIWLNPKPSDQKVKDEWKDIVNKLSNGTHQIKVEMVAGNPSTYSAVEPVAVGVFNIVKGEGENFEADYGKTFDDVKAKMTDPDLEKKMLAAARDYADVNNYKEDFKAVKIANSDWTTIYHELTGAVVRRIIDVHCYAVWPDGHCTTQKFVFGQEYNGSGFSENVKFHGVTYGSYAENLNCK